MYINHNFNFLPFFLILGWGFLGSIGKGIGKLWHKARKWRIGSSIKHGIGRWGGAIGGTVGSIFPGVGTVVGGAIGGLASNLAKGKGKNITVSTQGGRTTIGYNAGTQQSGGSLPQPTNKMCFIATECYGNIPPQKFYTFRDNLPFYLVKLYYKISPKLIPIIRFLHCQKPLRFLLDKLVK